MADAGDIETLKQNANAPEFTPDEANALRLIHAHVQSLGTDDQGNPKISGPEDEKAVQYIQAYQANTTPHFDGNILVPAKFQPIDLTPPKQAEEPSTLEKAGNFAGGLAGGIAEAGNLVVNPATYPHSIETLIRAPFQDVNPDQSLLGRISERFKKASDASVSPPMDINQMDQVANAVIKAPFSNQSFADLVKAEADKQSAAESSPGYSQGKAVGEIGMGVYGGVQAIKSIAGLVGKLSELKSAGSVIDAANDAQASGVTFEPADLLKAKDLQKKLIGDLGSDLSDALYQRTDKIKGMLDKGPDATNVLPLVQDMRTQLSTNKELLGQSVQELRNAVTQNDETLFDTSFARKSLSDLEKQSTLSGGKTVLSSQQQNYINDIKGLLQNPSDTGVAGGVKYNPFSTRDASLMIDHIDSVLNKTGFYADMEVGRKTDPVLNKIFNIRQGIDAELANMYPAFKEVKTNYSDFINKYNKFQNKINGMNAESFVSNLFGKNKTETRLEFESLMDKGNQTADSLKNLSKDALTGSREVNTDFNSSVQSVRDKAKDITFQSGKDFTNEVADRTVANKLAHISDPNADEIREAVRDYADRAASKGSTFGTGVGTFIGNHIIPGGPGAVIGGSVGGTSGRGLAYNIAKMRGQKIYSVDNLLKMIEASKGK